MVTDTIAGSLYGTAFGDALGADTEFIEVKAILNRYPPSGPRELQGSPPRVTDDTQMTLAVGEALLDAYPDLTHETLAAKLQHAFTDWLNTVEPFRAPGMTCISSIENLVEGQPWIQATNISSKGCGANMRVMPVAFLQVDASTRAAIAQFQAALTHAHPTAIAAADLTAFVIRALHDGEQASHIVQLARDYAQSQRTVYHATWLGDLWKRATMMDSPEAYSAFGWDECIVRLNDVAAALNNDARHNDPCLLTGAGWVAEEAFATALLCFLMYPDDAVATIQRGATTSGDSDSIACIAGAFVGAHLGLSAWPSTWPDRIEYRDRIQSLVDGLQAM